MLVLPYHLKTFNSFCGLRERSVPTKYQSHFDCKQDFFGKVLFMERVALFLTEKYWEDFCRDFARSLQHFSSGPFAEVAAVLVSKQNCYCSGRWIGSFSTLTATRLYELHSLVFWVEQFRRIHPSWVSHQVAKQTIKGWGAREVGSFFPAVLWAGTAVGDCCPPWCAMEKAEALKKEEGVSDI